MGLAGHSRWYFSLDDFNNSNLDRTYGILPSENILDDNILAIIPLSSETFDKNYIGALKMLKNDGAFKLLIFLIL